MRQVLNLRSAIKAAMDFVSPEHITRCLALTQQFRELPKRHPRQDDPLGTKAILLKDPVVKKSVGVFWVKTETIMPITKIAAEVGRSLAENNELQNFLYRPNSA